MQTKDLGEDFSGLGASAACSGTALSPCGSSREGVSPASPLQSTDAAAFLNAAGEVLRTLTGDEFSCVSASYSRFDETEHFTVYLHVGGRARQGIGSTLASAFTSARGDRP